MNLTVVSFSKSNSFDNSPYFLNNNFLLNKIQFLKIFSTLIYLNFKIHIFDIKNSKFEKILSTSIYINQYSTSITSGISYNSINCNIFSTFFKECSSTNYGGGLYFNGNNYNIKIECCSFYKCYSSIQGGGLFVDSSNNSTFFQNIFNSNSSPNSPAFRLGWRERDYPINYEFFEHVCEFFSLTSGHGSTHSSKNLIFKFNNCSNVILGNYGVFCLTYLNSNGIQFSNIINQRGLKLLRIFTDIKMSFNFINFLNNTGNTFISRDVTSTKSFCFNSCFFINFNFSILCANKLLEFYECSFNSLLIDTSMCLKIQSLLFNNSNTYLNIFHCYCFPNSKSLFPNKFFFLKNFNYFLLLNN